MSSHGQGPKDDDAKPSASASGGKPMPGTHGHGTHELDINEYGMPKDGERQSMNRRLFMQLLVYTCPPELHPRATVGMLGEALGGAFAAAKLSGEAGAVVYEDANNPQGLGVLSWSEDPATFVDTVRPALIEAPLHKLRLQPEYTMMGRTYSSGFEPDLPFWLLRRPAETASNAAWPWAVWYPLRRSGEFARLAPREQGGILREHAVIGRAYGEQDLAHDIRLACHGIDKNDNEFVIGLVGKELYPLSHVVQSMRKTRQTSEYIVQMGPFFVGRAVWRSQDAGAE
jgi:chlorite dismutase